MCALGSLMRALLLALTGTAFVLGFSGFFIADSVLTYVAEPEAVVESAHEAGLRDSAIEVIAELILAEPEAGPAPSHLDRRLAAMAVASVLTQDWIDTTIRTVHAAVLSMAESAEESPVIPFRPLRRALAAQVEELNSSAHQSAAQVAEACGRLFGAAECGSPEQAAALIDAYRAGAAGAVERIPEQVSLGHRVATLARFNLDLLRTARWVAIGLLAACLLLAALFARGVRRRLLSLGSAVAIAAILCLLFIGLTRILAQSSIGDRVVARLMAIWSISPESVEQATIAGVARFAARVLADATAAAWHRVGAIAVLGLFLIGLAHFWRSHRGNHTVDSAH
jgi:hypothetical protein